MTYDTDGDIIDRVADLTPGSTTHALRHQRAKVVEATQGSYVALFDPALGGLTLVERLLVALYASRLAPSPALVAHYRAELAAHEVDAVTLAAVETGAPEDLSAPRLRAILAFTRTLIENPVAGDKAALQTLPAAGLTTPAIVALAQLIAFLSYQTRLVAGLQALKQLERAS
ncbi:CMD domain-containing protein [Paraburkholderia acidiphila]|uniref:CMD domain protein n=1 Tax=Paraburkholderia acidiphila TaxID=2571747 RepID=A0A7Z2G8K2_9BURK|nr:CMD domain protein [Paraburkholderia acidiphila]QGZ57101.1 CMD domain protein [Paraburkholderia acidiphila]